MLHVIAVLTSINRLDKNVFKDGLSQLEARFEKRVYTTTLAFAHDLCEVIHVGINAEANSALMNQPRFEPIDVSPTKQNPYSEAKDRKRLGKRILKSIQPQLETALKAEAEITSKLFTGLQQELEGMIDASLEIRQPFGSQRQAGSSEQYNQDVIMVDAVEDGHVTVGGATDCQVDDEAGEQTADKMDVDEQSIEVKEEESAQANANGGIDVAVASVDNMAQGSVNKPLPSLVRSAPTPPDMNGDMPVSQNSRQPAPLTPPGSNGSLGRATENALTEGGIPWYLKNFEPDGTTAIEEQWAGRAAVRSLSEELTDMDEEELNDLEFNVEDSTITASPVDAPPAAASARKLRGGSATGSLHVKKRLRSSARRR